jgi:repressor LexA
MEKNARDVFVNNLHAVMQERKKSQIDISRGIGVPLSTVSNWYNGVSYPRVDSMGMLADYLHVSMTRLTSEEDEEQENIKIIGRAAKKMSKEDQDKMMELLRVAFKEQFKDE